MGARTNIKLKYANNSEIYIYSHWGGGEDGELRESLKRAIARRQRWDDDMYLAAIIMREVLREHLEEETGFGIAPESGEEEFQTTEVDLDAQTVDGMSFSDFIND